MRHVAIALLCLTSVAVPVAALAAPLPSGRQLPPLPGNNPPTPAYHKPLPLPSGAELPPLPAQVRPAQAPPTQAPPVQASRVTEKAPPASEKAVPAADVRAYAPDPQRHYDMRVEPRPAEPVGRAQADHAARKEPTRGHVCFNPAETREKIATHRLTEPFRALRAGRLQGEALRARLCRWKPDEFVYEVFMLRRDGHVVRVYMNAQNGEAVGAPDGPDR